MTHCLIRGLPRLISAWAKLCGNLAFSRVHTYRVSGNEFLQQAKGKRAGARNKLTILEVKIHTLFSKIYSNFGYVTIFCETNFLKVFYILTARSVPWCFSVMNPFYSRLSWYIVGLRSLGSVRILTSCSSVFFFVGFFHEHSRSTGLQGKWEVISVTLHYHSDPLYRHLDISWAITAESLPLHIAGSWTRTANF